MIGADRYVAVDGPVENPPRLCYRSTRERAVRKTDAPDKTPGAFSASPTPLPDRGGRGPYRNRHDRAGPRTRAPGAHPPSPVLPRARLGYCRRADWGRVCRLVRAGIPVRRRNRRHPRVRASPPCFACAAPRSSGARLAGPRKCGYSILSLRPRSTAVTSESHRQPRASSGRLSFSGRGSLSPRRDDPRVGFDRRGCGRNATRAGASTQSEIGKESTS